MTFEVEAPVVAREAVDAALHQDEAELGVVVLSYSLVLVLVLVLLVLLA